MPERSFQQNEMKTSHVNHVTADIVHILMSLALKGKSPLPKTDILHLFDRAEAPTLALKKPTFLNQLHSLLSK